MIYILYIFSALLLIVIGWLLYSNHIFSILNDLDNYLYSIGCYRINASNSMFRVILDIYDTNYGYIRNHKDDEAFLVLKPKFTGLRLQIQVVSYSDYKPLPQYELNSWIITKEHINNIKDYLLLWKSNEN